MMRTVQTLAIAALTAALLVPTGSEASGRRRSPAEVDDDFGGVPVAEDSEFIPNTQAPPSGANGSYTAGELVPKHLVPDDDLPLEVRASKASGLKWSDIIITIASLPLLACLLVVPFKIVKKAGYSWTWGLLFAVPAVNLLLLIFFAFAEWPVEREIRTLRGDATLRVPASPNGMAGRIRAALASGWVRLYVALAAAWAAWHWSEMGAAWNDEDLLRFVSTGVAVPIAVGLAARWVARGFRKPDPKAGSAEAV
jgi:hypothetical protein